MHSHLNSVIDALSLDHLRGAAEIVADAEQLFLLIAKLGHKAPSSSEHIFSRAIRRLAKGQPSMAPVLNLLNNVCAAREMAGDDWESFGRELKRLDTEYGSIREGIASYVGELPKVTGNLITISNSSTVATAITGCHRLDWGFKVWIGEARPMLEGIKMAKKLIASGVDVTILTDAALMSRITEADAVWVGGDSLSRDGLVNKIGSKALAILANLQNIPFISVMGTDKLMSPRIATYFNLLPQNPREITNEDNEELKIVNEYYETVPLDLVTCVLTEKGLTSPKKILQTVEDEPICPLFQKLVDRDRRG